jgi:hypothetical protein
MHGLAEALLDNGFRRYDGVRSECFTLNDVIARLDRAIQ